MKFLVTGATGDVGLRVVRLLLECGERPRVFVRDARKARAIFGDQVDAHVGDLSDGVKHVLRREPTGLNDWIRENAEAFRE
jgi:nucleoside-diphosphate-sugar epimerase